MKDDPLTTKRRKVLVFGGSGFIGEHLSRYFINSGAEVHVADLVPPKSKGVHFLKCDVRERIEINHVSGFDTVYNLAAVHRTPGHEPHAYYETNIAGAINITNWCRENIITELFFASSISVYGRSNSEITENSPTSPETDYGRSKLLAERIHQIWASEEAIRRLVICRPAVIFGNGENGNFSRLAKAISRNLFIIPGDDSVVKPSGYVTDLIESILFVQSKNSNVTYNFSFPSHYTIGEICREIASIGQYSIPKRLPVKPLLPIIRRLGTPMSYIAIRASKLLDSNYVLPKFLIDSNFVWKYDLNSSLLDWYKESGFDLIGPRNQFH